MSGLLGLATALISPFTELAGKFIEDKDKAAQLAYQMSRMAEDNAQEAMMGQLAVNKAEAESGSVWKGGWRPFVGWTCGLALFNNFVVAPYLILFGLPLAVLDLSVMLPVLLGMLGLAGIRGAEKWRGVAAP